MLVDLDRSCRLCFQSDGEKDVTAAPDYLRIIKDLYNVEIKSDDKYSKLLCARCLRSVLDFHTHKQFVESGQKIMVDRIKMLEEMSQMKVESGTDRECQIPIIQKEEVITDDIDDDQMTEDPPSPRIPPSPPISPPNLDNSENLENAESLTQPSNPPIQSDPSNPPSPSSSQVPDKLDSTESNQQLTETVEPVQTQCSSDRVRKTGADGLNAPDVIAPAGRITRRRFTTAGNHAAEPVTSFAQTRKRRMSLYVSTRLDIVSESHSPSIDEHEPITAKRMRMNEKSDETNKIVAKSNVNSESNVTCRNEEDKAPSAKKHSNQNKSVPNSTSNSNSVNNSSLATATPPQKSKESSQKQRKKSTVPLTPITQFFNKTSVMKCDKCAVTLSTRNELNFHRNSHSKEQCAKCREHINNDDPASIRGHMISCLLLNNQLPQDTLTHFLKVKVDLNRLTPTKIAQIQKTLTNESKQRRNERIKKLDQASTENVERTKKVGSTQQTIKESQLAADHAQNSTDESNDGRNNGTKKTKSKKPINKSTKSGHNDSSDELTIKENISAKLNWIDEPSKDKLFTVRNFESDAKVYREIKRIVEKSSNLVDEMKLTNFVKRMTLLKQQMNSGVTPHEPNRKPQNSSNTQTPINAKNASNVTPRAPITQQQPTNSPSNSNGQSAPYAPHAPHTPNGQFTLMVPKGVSGQSNGPSLPYAPHTPNVGSTPIPMASFVPNPVTTTNESMNTASNIVTSTPIVPGVPQLLGLPQRVPFRNRAMSMHYSAAEYNPAQPISGRRQSVCDHFAQQNQQKQQHQQYKHEQPQQQQQRQFDHRHGRHQPYPGAQQGRAQSQLQPGVPQPVPPPYMTKVHSSDLVLNAPSPQQQLKTATPPVQSTLKVLSVDDLNSRAANSAQPIHSNSTSNRIDSPNSAENNTNLNNKQKPTVQPVKRIRTKTTPLRSQSVQINDDANITISVSLTKLGEDRAELSLTTTEYGKLNYDTLTEKRRGEVRSSLLKDNVWLKMLQHLKKIRPTTDTLNLFQKILPKSTHEYFINELRKVWGFSLN